MTIMKYALILHGWPQYKIDKYFLSGHLRKKGYKVTTPNMFTENYVLSPENVLANVLTRLKGKELDLIVGISLGGLILPHMARHFPKAKLIFIASGPKLKSKSKKFNLTIKVIKLLLGLRVPAAIMKLPNFVITFFYRLANPFKGNVSRKEIPTN